MKEIPTGLKKLGDVEVCSICGMPLERMKLINERQHFFSDYFLLNHLLTKHESQLKVHVYKHFVKTYKDYSENPIFTGLKIRDVEYKEELK